MVPTRLSKVEPRTSSWPYSGRVVQPAFMCSFRRIRSGKSGRRAAPHFRTMIRAQINLQLPARARKFRINFTTAIFRDFIGRREFLSIPIPSIENVQLWGFSEWKSRNFSIGDITRHQENRIGTFCGVHFDHRIGQFKIEKNQS